MTSAHLKVAPHIQTEISLDGNFKTLIHTLKHIFYEFVNKTTIIAVSFTISVFFKRS